MIDVERTRDFFVVAGLFGVFGFAWFGWGQEAPPQRWRIPLGVGSGVALLVAVAGGVLSWLHWSAPSSIDSAEDGRFFGFVVALEVVLALTGSLVAFARRAAHWIAPWVSLVVGVHFVPLVVFFANATLVLPTVAMVVSAAVAVRVHRRRGTTTSAVTAVVNGPVLVLTGAANLALGLTL